MNSQKGFTQAPTAKNIFDKAFVFSISLVIIVGGIWATEKILIYLLDRQITEYKEITATSLASVSAEDVQAVHDVTSRLASIEENVATKVNTGELFAVLERTTIPQVRLTRYEYESDGAITLEGVAGDYRFLAEQILRYRQEATLATAEVGSTGRTESGQVTFDIRIKPVKKEETPAPSVAPPAPTI